MFLFTFIKTCKNIHKTLNYRVAQKVSYCILSISLLNIDQFSQFFHQ